MTFLSELSQLSNLSDFSQLGYFGLFMSAFLAATILPLSSEVVLSALVLSGLPSVTLVIVATVGNVLGSLVNYGMGYAAADWISSDAHPNSRIKRRIKKWFAVSAENRVKAEQRFGKYGLWALCFAWVPVIGDPLTVIAGALRIKLLWFVLLVTLGKFLRYVAVVYAVGHI